MAKFDLMQFAQTSVAQGEEVLGAVRVNWNGMSQASVLAGGGITGLSGLLESGAPVAPPDDTEGPDPDTLVGFPSAKQMAIVLTGGRLLIWALGFSGKPKDYLGEVPLSAIAEVQGEIGSFGSVLRFTLKSTAVVDLEVLRGEPGEEFSAQVQRLVNQP